MKRILSILLAVLLVFALLTACGGGGEGETTPPADDGGEGETTPPADDGGEETPPADDGGSQGGTTGSGEAFDNFPRPTIVEDGKLTFAYIHNIPTAESQSRSLAQAKIEARERGWEMIDIEFQDDSQINDLIANAVNQGVDAILLGNMQNMEAKINAIAEAREAGVGIYNNDNMIVDGVISNVTMPNGGSAMDLIYTIGEIVNWTAKVCIVSTDSIQVWVERHEPIEGIINAYPGLELLDYQDCMQGSGTSAENAYNIGAVWCTQFGEEMEGVIGGCDQVALQCNQAAMAAATVNPDLWMCGIDGGNECWYTIREAANGNGYFKYSYAQPFELYTHTCFEIMDQIQVQGMNPGDEGCIISKSGGVYYAEGSVVTPDNVPASGQNINAAYSYYDANDQDAWFNWEGTMTIE